MLCSQAAILYSKYHFLSQASQAQNTWCMRQLCVYRELYGKITVCEKSHGNNLSFEKKWKKFFFLKCVANLSLVPILKPFWHRLVKLFETVTLPSKLRMEGGLTVSNEKWLQ